MEDDGVVAAEEGEDFCDLIDVDDGGAVDADEAGEIEAALEVVHGVADEVIFFAEMQADVVTFGLDPLQL